MANKDTKAAGLQSLAALNVLDKTEWQQDEDGITNRPNLTITATLCHETEDYIRIIKTLADIEPIYFRALKGTYDAEDASRRYLEFRETFVKLRDIISHDMGYCIGDRLEQWQADYL